MNLQPAFLKQKLLQLEKLDRNKQLDQVFEWVKTGHISRAIFKGLITYVEHYHGVPIECYPPVSYKPSLEQAQAVVAEHQRQVSLDSPN